jgi:hypothetical protein
MKTHVPEDITEFVRGKSGVGRDGEVVKPEFGFTVSSANVNMRGFAALVGIKEGPVRSPP